MTGSVDQTAAAPPPRPGSSTRPPSDAPGGFLAGQLIGDRYRIVQRLGRGGMGVVYRADDLELGQSVALKFLPEALAADAESLERLRGEVRLARQVSHANVCRVFDVGQAHGRMFISMEYVDGEDLASLLLRIGRLPKDKATEIARQLCAGVQAAHEEEILHRDLKPANVMIDGRGRVKVTDFGLAQVEGRVDAKEVVAGTPAYMAPEQLAGKDVSARSDIYSLGLVLYELFTGRSAFEEADGIAPRPRDSTPMNPSQHVEGLAPEVESAILQCLEEDPTRRPSSALAVAASFPGGDALSVALAAGETPSPELVAAAGKREALSLPVAALLAIAALALFTAATHWAGTMDMMHYLPLEKRPEVLIDRARGIVEELGFHEPAYQEPVDSAWGFLRWDSVFDEVRTASDSDDRWEGLRQRPDAASFWYRQSPYSILPHPGGGDPFYLRGLVRVMNPTPVNPGEVIVTLDLAGNLRRWEALPKRFSTRQSAEPDWQPLFELAGLDRSRFEPAEPRYQRFHDPDVRRAWVGTRAELPDVEVRVEAGAFEGRPTLFNVASAAGLRNLAEDPEPSPQRLSILSLMEPFTGLAILLFALPMTRRHLKQGRADRRGAARFAGFLFVVFLIVATLMSDTSFSREWVGDMWPVVVASTFLGVTAWSVYIAAEPIGRRVWPRMFVSSNRLLSRPRFRWRDSLIGRSVLIGVLFGTVRFLVQCPVRQTILGARYGEPVLYLYEMDLLLGQRYVVGELLKIVLEMGLSFFFVVGLVILRLLVKRSWLAVGLAVILWTLLDGVSTVEGLTYGIAASAVSMVVLLRWGVVAMLVTNFTAHTAWIARGTDWSSWHGEPAVVATVFVAAVAAFGVWAAVREQSSQPV